MLIPQIVKNAIKVIIVLKRVNVLKEHTLTPIVKNMKKKKINVWNVNIHIGLKMENVLKVLINVLCIPMKERNVMPVLKLFLVKIKPLVINNLLKPTKMQTVGDI